jgi:hypothetical protein
VIATVSSPDNTDATGATVTFGPDNVLDRDPETAWRFPGAGMGRQVTMQFADPVLLSEIGVIPGYAVAEAGVDQFSLNRRISRLRLEYTNGSQEISLNPDQRTLQPVALDAPVATQFLRVTILETTEPAAVDGRDFTAISELRPFGRLCTTTTCADQAVLQDVTGLALGVPDQILAAERLVSAPDPWVRFFVAPRNRQGPTHFAYWQRTGEWEEVIQGPLTLPDSVLVEHDVPEQLWP